MKKTKIFFKNSKGQKLTGVLYSPENKKDFPIAIFCHGYKSSKETRPALALGEALPKKGIGLFAFDLSGTGESEGDFKDSTITQYIDDLNFAIELISEKTGDIALIGPSLGGLVSLNKALKEKRIKTLVLVSPLSHFRGQVKKELIGITKRIKSDEKGKSFGLRFYLDALKYMTYSRYKKIGIPTLIMHGDSDEMISFNDSIKLNCYLKNSNLIIIKGADHRYSKKDDFDKVINKTTDFLQGI